MKPVEKERDTIKEQKPKVFTVKNMARIAILSAISFVLYMFVKTPLPSLFPVFLDIQVSDIPALLGGFAMGPWAGVAIIIIKCCLKMPFSGTMLVGEVADILIGTALVLPAALIYNAKKSKKWAVIGLITGTFASTATAILANRFILIPLYTTVLLPWEALLGMLSSLYGKAVTRENFYSYYLWLAVLPFNLLRLFLVDVVTLAIYKPLRRILHS